MNLDYVIYICVLLLFLIGIYFILKGNSSVALPFLIIIGFIVIKLIGRKIKRKYIKKHVANKKIE
jgi:hypothetical protein